MTIMEQSDRKGHKGKAFHFKRRPPRTLRIRPPRTLRIVIAGGGTGGHLFPGIAIAQEFMTRNSNNSLLFVGTGKPFEIAALSEAGFTHKHITAEGIKGRSLWNQVVSILKIPKGVFESILILKHFKPDIVVGVGGYSAGPLPNRFKPKESPFYRKSGAQRNFAMR